MRSAFRGHDLWQDLDRDLPLQAAVARAVDFAYPANAQHH
jgi:hypothetical protein